MIPNNNLSVLPWYTSIEQQNARKWWAYNRIYPLFTPAGYILPFQLSVPFETHLNVGQIYLYDGNTDELIGNIKQYLLNTGLTTKRYSRYGYDIVIYPGILPAFTQMQNGRYYLRAIVNNIDYYSDIFTVVNDIYPYLKIVWWDLSDFTMDAGTIAYTEPAFKNILYLRSDIAKPEYQYEEEGENRDGYFFPIKQVSEKRYRFNFLASEYLLDVMRFIRMADFAEIIYRGQRYSLDTFLITPNWDENGDIAIVEAEFTTATVAKKIGTGYIKAQRGDYNDDFNDDFNNE